MSLDQFALFGEWIYCWKRTWLIRWHIVWCFFFSWIICFVYIYITVNWCWYIMGMLYYCIKYTNSIFRILYNRNPCLLSEGYLSISVSYISTVVMLFIFLWTLDRSCSLYLVPSFMSPSLILKLTSLCIVYQMKKAASHDGTRNI